MSTTLSGQGLRSVTIKTAAYTVVANTDNGKTFSTEFQYSLRAD